MEYDFDFLNKIFIILEKYKELEKKSGYSISILKVTGKEHDEVVICRLIAFLLNPNELHNQNTKFLNLYLKEIGEEPIQKDEYFDVITEFPTDKGRRIDIVLKSNKRFIPIEVKIYATDQKEQCVHYYEFSSKNFNANKVYYLTPYEHTPDISSMGYLSIGTTLQLITFKEHILNWLEKCEIESDVYTPLLKEFLRELKIAIRKFCGLVENREMNDEILREIIKDKKQLEAAKAIYSIGNEIKTTILWEEFCKNIEPNSLGDWHKFNYEEEYDSNNALTVSVDEDKVFIHFYELFNYIVIDVQDNKELSEKIQTQLKKIYQDFVFESPSNTGFAVNNTQTYFIENSINNPFDLYNTFMNRKVELINKMQKLIEVII